MMWNGSWGWWWPGLLFMIICMVMMMRMMSHGTHGSHTGEGPGRQADGAEHILAERLARGEIDIEEYERRLEVLRGPGSWTERRT